MSPFRNGLEPELLHSVANEAATAKQQLQSTTPPPPTIKTTPLSQLWENAKRNINNDYSTSLESSAPMSGSGSGILGGDGYRMLPFPHRLHQMLLDVENMGKQNIVSWMPGGQSFKVHKPSQFIKEISPHYFNLTQYKSFKRQLINYGFVRVSQSKPGSRK